MLQREAEAVSLLVILLVGKGKEALPNHLEMFWDISKNLNMFQLD
jgi:hypothetical protein